MLMTSSNLNHVTQPQNEDLSTLSYILDEMLHDELWIDDDELENQDVLDVPDILDVLKVPNAPDVPDAGCIVCTLKS